MRYFLSFIVKQSEIIAMLLSLETQGTDRQCFELELEKAVGRASVLIRTSSKVKNEIPNN